MTLFVCASKYIHTECEKRSLWTPSWLFKIEVCNIPLDLFSDVGMCKKLVDKELL
jgi:hypothetical protein